MPNRQSKKGEIAIKWMPIIVFILVAIAFRFFRTSTENHYLLAGSDGPYFPLQVKSIFEQFRLAFPDMPLLFTICAFLAKILYLLHLGTENESILLSVKFIDSFLPPLSAIPVFLIAGELTNENLKSKFPNYLMVAFAILSFTPLFIFSYQLQKNGLATVGVFTYLYYALKIIKYKNRNDIVKLITVVILCTLTHFGSFGLLIFITLLLFVFGLIFKSIKIQKDFIIGFVLTSTMLTSIFILVAILDYTRFLRILNAPFKLFEAPVILFALKGQNFILHGQTLIILIAMNFLSIQAILILFGQRKSLENYKIILGFSLATCTLFLSSPLLGIEWANRLFMIAYIPITVLYLIIYNSILSKWIKIQTTAIFILLLTMSFAFAVTTKPFMSISKNSYLEFTQIKNKILFSKNDAIVSRQDIRLLANWTFETKGVSDYLLTKEEFNKYSSVYLLRQLKDKHPQLRSSEPPISDNCSKIFQGEYFELYKLNDNRKLPIIPKKIFRGVKGTIIEISNYKILVQDYRTNKIRTVFLKKIERKNLNIYNGMKVEINGELTPFSLSINAETLLELENFD